MTKLDCTTVKRVFENVFNQDFNVTVVTCEEPEDAVIISGTNLAIRQEVWRNRSGEDRFVVEDDGVQIGVQKQNFLEAVQAALLIHAQKSIDLAMTYERAYREEGQE